MDSIPLRCLVRPRHFKGRSTSSGSLPDRGREPGRTRPGFFLFCCGSGGARHSPSDQAGSGSPDLDGEDSRRGAEAQRGDREDKESAFCDCLGLRATNNPKIPSQKKVWIRAWALPTLVARSKTPPRPLRETLRIRMGRTRAEAQRGDREDKESAFCDCLGLRATNNPKIPP
jgi:hypothetical protein